MKPMPAVMNVETYMLDRTLLLGNNSWNMKRPKRVAVSKLVNANAETAKEIMVKVMLVGKPIFAKKPEIAVANTTAGADAPVAAIEPSADNVPIAIKEITASTHSINIPP